MTVQEFYKKIDGDFDGTLSRLMKEDRIRKYVLKFSESGEFDALVHALEEKDYETAFRSSHTLKGVCLNLGFSKLAASGSALCEELRNGPPKIDVGPMLEQVRADYNETMSAIEAFKAE